MVELHSDASSGRFRTFNNPTPCLDLVVIPQADIAWGNTAFRAHRSGFDDDHAEPADGAGDIMLIVERRRLAVLRVHRIGVHRRQPDAVAHRQAAQLERLEQLAIDAGLSLVALPLDALHFRGLIVFRHIDSFQRAAMNRRGLFDAVRQLAHARIARVGLSCASICIV